MMTDAHVLSYLLDRQRLGNTTESFPSLSALLWHSAENGTPRFASAVQTPAVCLGWGSLPLTLRTLQGLINMHSSSL